MVLAKDGSDQDRSLIKPDRNNVGPRLGFALPLTPTTVVRGGYGVSYIHFHRAGAGNLLPINGPQVVNAVANQTNPADPSFVTTQQGYPDQFADPSKFNPPRPTSLHARRLPLEPGPELLHLGQREIARNMIVDVAYVGNRADDLLLFANFNQAAPNNAAGTLSLQSRPIPEFADITYAFNGGKSRYNSLQVKLTSTGCAAG